MPAPEGRGHGDAQEATALRDQLERGFRRLTPEQRAVLVVHHYLGLPDAEAAMVLEIPDRHLQGPTASRLDRHARSPRGRRAHAGMSPGSPSHEQITTSTARWPSGSSGRAGSGPGRWCRASARRRSPAEAATSVARRSRAATGAGRYRRATWTPASGCSRGWRSNCVDRARPPRAARGSSWAGRSSSEPVCWRLRRCRPRASATWPMPSTATSSWPTGTGGTLSGSRTVFPAASRAAARPATGPRDRCGRRTAGSWPIDPHGARIDATGPKRTPSRRSFSVIRPGTSSRRFPGVGWRIAWSPDSTRVATWLDLYPSTRIGVYGIDGVRQAVISLPPGNGAARRLRPGLVA